MDSAVLSILQADDRYTVTLETPRKGPLALAGTVWVGHEHRLDIVRIVDAVTALINRQAGSESPYRGDVSDMAQVCEVGSLEEFGRLMYGLFLPPLIQNALRDFDAPLIISTNDSQIPWELLHDGQAFLGLRSPITRRLMVTRWVAGNEGAVTAEPTFLIISNPLGDLPEADSEADDLMALLETRGVAYDLLRGPRATYIAVQQALVSGRYEVIHYTGHAFFETDHPDRSGLHLAGGRNLPASQIEGILRGRPIVFLNACSSARQGEASHGWEVGYTGPQAEGLASAFVSGGAAGFLGAQWPIFDAGSRAFATAFYQALLNGAATGDAMQTARAHVREARPSDATWASFILYGDPALRIAETSEEMIERARAAHCAGDGDRALEVIEQVRRRGPSAQADEAARQVEESQAEKKRLAALYTVGMESYRRGVWDKAAEALAPVVAAESGHVDAAPALIEARRQIELASLLAQARQQIGKRRWRTALDALERIQNQDPNYANVAELAAQVQTRMQAERATPMVPRGLLTMAVALVALLALAGLWTLLGGGAAMPPPTPPPPSTLAPLVAAPPTSATVIIVYVTQTVAPSPTVTPTPTRPAGWQRVDALGGAIVRSIAMDDLAANIYLGTWGGGVQRSRDGGQTWQAINNGLSNQHIWTIVADPISRTVIYAGSNGGGLFRSSNGGETWAPASTGIESGFIYALTAVAREGKTTLWAGTGQGRVYVSDDRSQTWKAAAGQPPAAYINVLYHAAARAGQTERIYVGADAGVFVSADGGVSWKALPLRSGEHKPDIRDIVGDPRDDKVLYAGVAGEGVYRTRDGGQTWTLVNQGMDNVRVRTLVIDPGDAQILYVGTDGGRVFRTSNGGERWESASAGLAGRSVQALVARPFQIYAGTWGDGIFRSTDAGRNWTAMNGNLKALNVAAALGDPGGPASFLLAAYGKGIFHTDDDGRTWTPRQNGLSTEDVFSLISDPRAAATVYALTADGIFKTADMGMKWQSISTGLAQERPLALAVAPSDTHILYASAGDGYVYRSDDQGARWLRVEGRIGQAPVMALAVDPRSPALVYAGSSAGIHRSSDGGRTWVKVHDALAFALAVDPLSGDVFASDSRGGVWHSRDSGAHWLRAGLENSQIVTLAVSARGGKEAILFAGTSNQGVFISRDGGAAWQALDGASAPFVQAVSVHPALPYDILVATSNGLYVRSLPAP